MKAFGFFIHQQLQKPLRIFWFCAVFTFVSLLANGSLMSLYSLRRDRSRLTEQIQEVRAQMLDLDLKIKKAKDPADIQRQALDRYELGEEGDLIFVFPEE